SMRVICLLVFFFSSRRRHTRFSRDWSSDVCSSDLPSDDDQMHLRSLNYAESYTFRPSAPLPVPEKVEWYSYFLAVCDQFLQRGRSEERRVGKECSSRGSADPEQSEAGS